MSSSIEDLAGVLRSQPIQERAKKRIGLILQTAAEVLEDEGVDGFNTNLIAERAGIPVSAIYIYFEDKFTILTALALRTVAAEVAAFHRFEGLADLDRDWREVLRGYSAEYARRTAELPGFVAIRKAISALPELRAVDRRADRTLARQFAKAAQRRGVKAPRRQLLDVGELFCSISTLVQDLARGRHAQHANELHGEAREMLYSHLARYLD